MRAIATALIAAAVLAVPAASSAKPKLTGEARLAKVLEGRVAGDPVSCIPDWQARDMQVIDKTALVYGHGSTIWVNRPKNADQLDSDDILVRRAFGSQLCTLDIVHTVDRTGHFMTGIVNLGEFVPYRRVAKAD